MLGFVKSVWKVPMYSSRDHVQENAMGLWGSRSAYSGEPYIESLEVLKVYSTKSRHASSSMSVFTDGNEFLSFASVGIYWLQIGGLVIGPTWRN